MAGKRVYAVGDVHGQLDYLKAAHRLIAEDARRSGGPSTVVHVGDLTDRGPDSKGVIDFLIAGKTRGEDWVVLKGNHDRLFHRFIQTGEVTEERLRSGLNWTSPSMGGGETLASYGVKPRLFEKTPKLHSRAVKAVPQAHVDFLSYLPLWHREDGLIFVHAGIRPGFPLEAQDEDDLVWIRDEFLWRTEPHEAMIVHGHTPVDYPTNYGNRINVDCGAGWGNEIVPIVLEDGSAYALTSDGRDQL